MQVLNCAEWTPGAQPSDQLHSDVTEERLAGHPTVNSIRRWASFPYLRHGDTDLPQRRLPACRMPPSRLYFTLQGEEDQSSFVHPNHGPTTREWSGCPSSARAPADRALQVARAPQEARPASVQDLGRRVWFASRSPPSPRPASPGRQAAVWKEDSLGFFKLWENVWPFTWHWSLPLLRYRSNGKCRADVGSSSGTHEQVSP
jgi:hypothetical protein